VAECEECRSLAASYAAVGARLSSLKSEARFPRGADCPAEDEWLSLANGLLSEERTERDMQHAANCDRCGPLLRRAVEDLGNDLTPEEASVVEGLKSSKPEWQKGFAKRLSAMTHDDPNTETAASPWSALSRFPRLAFVGAALGLAILVAWLGMNLRSCVRANSRTTRRRRIDSG
jgi:hypothetical protein